MQLAAVILNYNDAEGTVDAIERISGFSCIESIIAVDNASTDNSAELIREAIESRHDSRVHFIETGRNGGYGYGNNIGVRYAHDRLGAEHVLIANPDAVFDESLIENMLGVFEADADTAVVGAVMEGLKYRRAGRTESGYIELRPRDSFSYDEYISSGWKRRNVLQCMLNSGPVSRRIFKRYINYAQDYYTRTAVQDEAHSGETDLRQSTAAIVGQSATADGNKASTVAGAERVPSDRSCRGAVQVYAVHGSLLMVSSDKFIDAGGYDEAVFLYGEENILAERLLYRKYKTYLLRQGYKHIGSASISKTLSQAVTRQQLRNKSENYYYTHYLHCDESGMNIVSLFQRAVLAETRLAARLGKL